MGSRRAAQVPGMRAPQPTVRGNQRIGGLIDAVLSHGRSEPITTTALDAVCCSVCARSSTDRASDYGSEGWGFESLRARACQRPVPILGPASFIPCTAAAYSNRLHELALSPWSSQSPSRL